jgi:gliding motility-associated-like protein
MSKIGYLILVLLMTAANSRSNAQNLFIQNKGQLNAVVKYSKPIQNGRLFYRANGFTTLLKDAVAYDSMWKHFHQFKTLQHPFNVQYHRYDVNFINALPCDIETHYQASTKHNYFLGNNPNQWATNVALYHQIVYKQLYAGIDLQVIEKGLHIKHNFMVAPNADANQIALQYAYTDGMQLTKDGAIQIKTSTGNVIEDVPFAFQLNGTDTIAIKCKYVLTKKNKTYELRFDIGDYDHARQLIIDPLLVFATYSGSQGDNFGFTATHDSRAFVYNAGIVDGDQGPFPVTAGAFQTTYGGGSGGGRAPANLSCDIGINKFDSAGTVLLYSTYLGGTDEEYPHSLVVDNQDNLLVMGTTYSSDFPIIKSCYDSSFNGQTDLFVVKLSKDGSTMLAGTFIGGSNFDGLNSRSLRYNYADDFRGDIVVDSANNVFVASTTYSGNFPLKNAFQPTKGSLQEGCIFSFDETLTQLRFSTYAGGNEDDACYSIRLYDSFVYIGGGTASIGMNFTINGVQNSYNGGKADGFVLKLKQDGSFRNASYFGTSAYDQIYFIDIDLNGQIYCSGQTEGNISRTSGTYGQDNTSQFIMRFSPNLANVNLATTFGYRKNNPEISPSAFLVDQCDNIYFSGWGSDIAFGGLHSLTTNNLPITAGAIQSTTDIQDFYLLVMNKDAKNLLYATYFGGNKTADHVDGGTSRFDKRGVVYQAVCASCPELNGNQDFPVTPGAPFTNNVSPRCSNAFFKIDFQITFLVDAHFTATPKIGCEPLNVQFTNTSKHGKKFFWDYGDGSPIDTVKSPSHVYTKKGKYKVKLSSIDSFSCNIADYDSTEIEVLESPKAAFDMEPRVCENFFKFTNASTNYKNPVWDFGDSGALSTLENPEYKYKHDGIHNVILTVEHPTSGCKDTQSMLVQLFSDPTKTLKIPNVFTPDNDGKNDCFTIEGIDPSCDEAEVWIYDRWGILIFNGYLPIQCWNGELRNSEGQLPNGVYYYLMNIKKKDANKGDQTLKVNGVIQLIR